jgi:hypothetical protein
VLTATLFHMLCRNCTFESVSSAPSDDRATDVGLQNHVRCWQTYREQKLMKRELFAELNRIRIENRINHCSNNILRNAHE